MTFPAPYAAAQQPAQQYAAPAAQQQQYAAPQAQQYAAPPAYASPAPQAAGPFAPPVSLFGGMKVQENNNHLPFLEAGKHRVVITKTEFRDFSKSIAIEFTYVASETDPSLVGKACSRVFPTTGKDEIQRQRKANEWTSFAVAAMGYPSLAAFQANGLDPFALAGQCAMPQGAPGGQPITGRQVDVYAYDGGGRTRANPAKNRAGNEVILDYAWSPVN